MGWKLDSTEHATFNWIRPIPAYSKVGSQLNPAPLTALDTPRIIAVPTLHMRVFKRRFVFRICVVLLILFWATALGPEPLLRIFISPDELVRAVTIQRESLIELCLIDHVDPNGHDAQGRTPLLIAASQQDWKTAQRLMGAGALVELADKNGFTPLMAAAVHGNLEIFRELLARSTNLHAETPCKDGSDLLGMALDGGNPEIVRSVVQRLPAMPQWRSSTRRALQGARRRVRRSKSSCCSANTPRRQHHRARMCRSSRMPSLETIPPFLARFCPVAPIPTRLCHRVAIRISWRCSPRNHSAVMLKGTRG